MPVRVDVEGVLSCCLPAEELDRIHSLWTKVEAFFTSHSITYWADGGTLLGAIRHGDIVPWDDDMDVVLAPGEEQTLAAAKAALADVGLVYERVLDVNLMRIWDRDGLPVPKWGHRWPFVDLWELEERVATNADGSTTRAMWCKTGTFGAKNFPNAHYTIEEIHPLRTVKFGPSRICVPALPEQCLARMFGPTWREKGSTSAYNHRTERFVKDRFEAMLCDLAGPFAARFGRELLNSST